MIQLIDILAAGVTDSSGDVVANGSVSFYQAGTSTLVTVYQDNESSSPHSNPADLDAAGRLVAWADESLKLVISDEDGAVVRTIDGVGVSDADVSAANTNNIAGDGLELDGTFLDVVVDDETIEIDDNEIGIKDGGIRAQHFALQGRVVAPGASWNISIVNATTTDANDSIKITGVDGTALSATNPGYVALPDTTTGRIVALPITADVTIKLTGAHMGLDTLGDFTVFNRVYAINDTNAVKWGVSNQGGFLEMTVAGSSTTTTNITTQAKMLVNTTLSGTCPCAQVGYFRSSFDDTGGAAADIWTVLSTTGSLVLGLPVPTSNWTAYTPTGSWVSNVTYTGSYKVIGDTLHGRVKVLCSGAPTSANLTMTLPTGFVIDSTKMVDALDLVMPVGQGTAHDSGVAAYLLWISPSSTANSIRFDLIVTSASNGSLSPVNATGPFTFGSPDFVVGYFAVPVRGYSA